MPALNLGAFAFGINKTLPSHEIKLGCAPITTSLVSIS